MRWWERFLPLARNLARRYRRGGEPLEDLEQVACLALVRAVEAFDPARDVAFSSYVVPTITGALKRHHRDCGWSVRVPRDLQELAMRVQRLSEAAAAGSGVSPTAAQIAQHAGVSVEEVIEAREAYQALYADSLDQPRRSSDTDDESVSLLETIGTRDTGFEGAFDRVLLDSLLETLEERDRAIVRLTTWRSSRRPRSATASAIRRCTSRACSAGPPPRWRMSRHGRATSPRAPQPDRDQRRGRREVPTMTATGAAASETRPVERSAPRGAITAHPRDAASCMFCWALEASSSPCSRPFSSGAGLWAASCATCLPRSSASWPVSFAPRLDVVGDRASFWSSTARRDQHAGEEADGDRPDGETERVLLRDLRARRAFCLTLARVRRRAPTTRSLTPTSFPWRGALTSAL